MGEQMMRTAMIVSVTASRQLEIPPEIQAHLNPGDEYLIWQTEDTLVFKKVDKPMTLQDLLRRIEDLGPDSLQPSEAEICQMVKSVRHKRGNHEGAAGLLEFRF
jgi:bifunctional DNA-binding transcriptional regulator/antitoxin component of YhaV-PrlF toxin-antitoxin module